MAEPDARSRGASVTVRVAHNHLDNMRGRGLKIVVSFGNSDMRVPAEDFNFITLQ